MVGCLSIVFEVLGRSNVLIGLKSGGAKRVDVELLARDVSMLFVLLGSSSVLVVLLLWVVVPLNEELASALVAERVAEWVVEPVIEGKIRLFTLLGLLSVFMGLKSGGVKLVNVVLNVVGFSLTAVVLADFFTVLIGLISGIFVPAVVEETPSFLTCLLSSAIVLSVVAGEPQSLG